MMTADVTISDETSFPFCSGFEFNVGKSKINSCTYFSNKQLTFFSLYSIQESVLNTKKKKNSIHAPRYFCPFIKKVYASGQKQKIKSYCMGIINRSDDYPEAPKLVKRMCVCMHVRAFYF